MSVFCMELPNGLRLVSEIWINQIHIPRHIFFTKGPHMANNSIKSYSKVKWYKLILYCPKSMYFQSFELTLDTLSIIFLPLKGILVPRIPLKFGQWHPTHWGENAKTIFFWLQVCKRYRWPKKNTNQYDFFLLLGFAVFVWNEG